MVSIHALLAECDTPAVKLLMHFAGFNPRTPCGVRPPQNHQSQLSSEFQSTHSLRSATPGNYPRLASVPCFNPRTPCGVRPDIVGRDGKVYQFQSTHSLRSATKFATITKINNMVSIHALLAECDCRTGFLPARRTSFNPRTPCGVRPAMSNSPMATARFQSTHSLRSATFQSACNCWKGNRFNPRTPCGVRQAAGCSGGYSYPVSIHALLAECDMASKITSTLVTVSIHALLAECDKLFPVMRSICWCFNPRTPCGVRPANTPRQLPVSKFQSTHSLRSATCRRAQR